MTTKKLTPILNLNLENNVELEKARSFINENTERLVEQFTEELGAENIHDETGEVSETHENLFQRLYRDSENDTNIEVIIQAMSEMLNLVQESAKNRDNQNKAQNKEQNNEQNEQNVVPIPTPLALPERHIYHATSAKSFQGIIDGGSIVPLNWLIEGTHGKEVLEGAKELGADAARGESKHVTMGDFNKELEETKSLIKSEKLKKDNEAIVQLLEKRLANMALGRKQDFVYGTQNTDSVAGYADLLRKGYFLRWVQSGEDYHEDQDQPNAIKTLEEISVDRLEFATFELEKDTNMPDGSVKELNWKKVSEMDVNDKLTLRMSLLIG